MSAQGEPVRSRQNMPLSTVRSSARGTPLGLLGSNGAMITAAKLIETSMLPRDRARPA
jgi:hypothetical protein